MRLIDADVLKEDLTRFYDGEVTARQLIDAQPSVQPEPCEDDPRADVYYLAEKIGIHQLYALVVQLRGEPEPCEDAISRRVAIEAIDDIESEVADGFGFQYEKWREYFCELPSVQPATNCSEIPNGSDDTISRRAAIDALARMMPRSYTPDGSHPGDEEIFRAQEVFADCIEALEILPSAQLEIIRCKDCDWWTKQEDSVQGRCELMQMYPAGGWYCGNARRRLE